MNILSRVAADFGVELTPAQLDKFQTFYEQLIDWNQRMNLTGITTCEDVQIKHFADSLAIVSAVRTDKHEGQVSLVDIGAGAGFPGLPLKIARPAWQVTLVESTRKKTEFIEHMIYTLDLEGVAAVWGRAEEIGQDSGYRGRFDVAVARAVAEMAVLVEYALPLLRVGGQFVAQKGTEPADEVQRATRALEVMGGAHRSTIPYSLPGFDDALHLVIIEKVAPTPEKYPRRPGMPEKRPIG